MRNKGRELTHIHVHACTQHKALSSQGQIDLHALGLLSAQMAFGSAGNMLTSEKHDNQEYNSSISS